MQKQVQKATATATATAAAKAECGGFFAVLRMTKVLGGVEGEQATAVELQIL
jgi:hypothetical protein